MPWVSRDTNDKINGLYANKQAGYAEEFLEDADPEVLSLTSRAQTVSAVATPRQARLALLDAGLLAAVEAAVKTAGGATQITWEYATEIKRDDALITTIGTSLGLTDAAIDLLFKKASLII